MPQSATQIPLDGRITSLQILDIPITGGEVMEIVAPGDAATGNNFQVTTSVLATYLAQIIQTTIVQIVTVPGTTTVATSTTALMFRKSVQSDSPFNLPAGIDGKVIEVADVTGLAGDMTAIPNGADMIMGVNGPMIVASSGGIPQSGGVATLKFYSAISGWVVSR